MSKVTRDALTERIYKRNATDEREAFASLAGGRYMCARLDKRCWLEVEDKRHRYAKNLRRYHYEWVRLERPKGDFFEWLDSRAAVWQSNFPRGCVCSMARSFHAVDASMA